MKLGDLRGEPRDLAWKLIGTFLLWLPFSVAAVAAIPLCLVATWLEQWAYAKAVIAAMDRLAAAVLGWGRRLHGLGRVRLEAQGLPLLPGGLRDPRLGAAGPLQGRRRSREGR